MIDTYTILPVGAEYHVLRVIRSTIKDGHRDRVVSTIAVCSSLDAAEDALDEYILSLLPTDLPQSLVTQAI
ncbi:MAG: hypothetical protein DRI98_12115 [Bacteroidetes bacterium]|nr:MAG: hypothetical protein DRI98_12115 [Bacteroidota bacterium]